MDTKVDEVIQSRHVYMEAQERMDNLVLNAEELDSEELEVRKLIDSILGDTSKDGLITYQMNDQRLKSIKSKQQHIRQSTGLARKALMDALDDYNSDLRARTIKRKVELRATLQTELPLLLDALSIAASDVLVSISFLDNLPPNHLDLKKIINKHNNEFFNDVNTRTSQLLAQLEDDNYEIST